MELLIEERGEVKEVRMLDLPISTATKLNRLDEWLCGAYGERGI